jgi:hypothetical protein
MDKIGDPDKEPDYTIPDYLCCKITLVIQIINIIIIISF